MTLVTDEQRMAHWSRFVKSETKNFFVSLKILSVQISIVHNYVQLLHYQRSKIYFLLKSLATNW